MSSLTNSLLLSMILLIFSICFFLVSSVKIFLFSVSSFTLLIVLFSDEFGVDFFTGDSFNDIIAGLGVLGMMFSLENIAVFFFSLSFLTDSYRLFSSMSLSNYKSFCKYFMIFMNLSLFLLTRMIRAKMNPLL